MVHTTLARRVPGSPCAPTVADTTSRDAGAVRVGGVPAVLGILGSPLLARTVPNFYGTPEHPATPGPCPIHQQHHQNLLVQGPQPVWEDSAFRGSPVSHVKN